MDHTSYDAVLAFFAVMQEFISEEDVCGRDARVLDALQRMTRVITDEPLRAAMRCWLSYYRYDHQLLLSYHQGRRQPHERGTECACRRKSAQRTPVIWDEGGSAS